MYHDDNIKYQLLCSKLSSRHCVVCYKCRHGNESGISWVEFRNVHNRGVELVQASQMDVFASVLLQLKCRRATIITGTKAATTATPHMPATARHGVAQATHTTSRTTANVSYQLWQHCCWQDTIAGGFASALFLQSFPRGLLQHCYHSSLFWCMFPRWACAAAVDMNTMSWWCGFI